MKNFNVRVYGICINEKNEVLLVNESYAGLCFTKFPGGGLEIGEGTVDCLKREFMEELNWIISDIHHFYTTDFYVKSAFDESQIISVYYFIKQFESRLPDESFIWRSIEGLNDTDVTFPIDKKVVEMLKNEIIKV